MRRPSKWLERVSDNPRFPRGRRKIAILAAVVLVSLAAFATAAFATTQYAFLDNSTHAGNTGSSYSVSYVYRANPAAGAGSVRYGFIYAGLYRYATCSSSSSCSKTAGGDFGIPPSVLECDNNSAGAFWSCKFP